MSSEIDKKQVAYIFGFSTQHAYRIGINTFADAVKAVKERQKVTLTTVRATWARLKSVAELAKIGTEASAEDYAWSIGYCGEEPLQEWLDKRLYELGVLTDKMRCDSGA